ncbi:hypothetical protein TKK_0015484 [Trichogramma kaykai]
MDGRLTAIEAGLLELSCTQHQHTAYIEHNTNSIADLDGRVTAEIVAIRIVTTVTSTSLTYSTSTITSVTTTSAANFSTSLVTSQNLVASNTVNSTQTTTPSYASLCTSNNEIGFLY